VKTLKVALKYKRGWFLSSDKGETPFGFKDPRARKTVRVEGEEASHEELPRVRKD